MLSYIIDETQSGFVPNRLITDNAIIVFEAFYWLQKGKSNEEKYMVMKLDMSKAYDRAEWVFFGMDVN